MSTLAFDRRRADRFARLLDAALGGPRHHATKVIDTDLAPLVTTTKRLALHGRLANLMSQPDASEPDPQFRAGLRAMLLATIEREGLGTTSRPTPEPPTRSAIISRTQVIRPIPTASNRRARTVVIAGVAAGAVVLSAAPSLADPVPGDPHYQTKRTGERTQLAIAGSDVSRGILHLEFATNRLQEALRRSDLGTQVALLSDMDNATRQGVRLIATAAVRDRDPSQLQTIERFVAAQRSQLRELLSRAPGVDPASVHGAAVLLEAAQQRVRHLTVALAQGDRMATIDDLGPRPKTR